MNLNIDQYRAFTSPMLSYINVGAREDCTTKKLVETVVKVIGIKEEIMWGTPKSGALLKVIISFETSYDAL